jgi:ABC-type iron transport system FetAB ATPase subunit
MKARVVALDVFQKVNGSLKVVRDLKTLAKFVTLDTHLSALKVSKAYVRNEIVHKLVRWLKAVPVSDRVSVRDREAVVQPLLDRRQILN